MGCPPRYNDVSATPQKVSVAKDAGCILFDMYSRDNPLRNIDEIMSEVETAGNRVEVMRHGRAVATIVPQEEWESLVESLNILSDDDTMYSLREAERDMVLGRLTKLE